MRDVPFPIPFGWFQVCWPDEVKPGEVKPLYYFGRDLVVWRDTDGGIHVQDAICPHLGSHLGHGGHVEGSDIMCPFHGWKFDGEGRNSEIPYSKRVNKSACLRTYEVIERNGTVMAWYHPFDEAPTWEIPEVPEFSDRENWSSPVTRIFAVPAPWQEIAENSVDSAHFRFVHNTDDVPEIQEYETDGPLAKIRSLQRFPTPKGVVDGRIDIDQAGPGFSVIRFSGIVDTLLMGCNIPVSEDETELRFTFTAKKLGDDALTSSVGQAFVDEVSRQVVEDIPIWRNKAHVTRPALADTDGPYLRFRKWASQFYAEGLELDEPVYPADRPDSARPEPQGTTKKTASARLKEEDAVRSGMMNT